MLLYSGILSSSAPAQSSGTLYRSLLHCGAELALNLVFAPEVQKKSRLTITPRSAFLRHIIISFTPEVHVLHNRLAEPDQNPAPKQDR